MSTEGEQNNSTNTVSQAGGQQNTSNNNNNNQRKNKYKKQNNINQQSKYVGTEATLAVLGVKNDSTKTDNFLVFQRSLENHVLSKFDHSGDIAYLIQELKDPMPRLMKQMPTIKSLKKDYGIDPDADEGTLSKEEQDAIVDLKELLSTERKSFVSRKATLQSNFPKLFGLIWGQCTPALQQDLRNLTEYKESYESRNCLWLLNELKKSSSGSDSTQHEVVTFIRTIRTLFTTRQRDNESLQDMGDRLDSQLQSLKLIGGTLHPKYLIESYSKSDPTKSSEEAKSAVEEKIMAVLTIEGANETKYGAVKRHLANQMVHGVDIYPDTKSQAQTLLAKYLVDDKKQNKPKGGKPGDNENNPQNDTGKINVSFLQNKAPAVDGPPVAGTDGMLQPHMRCFKCGRMGHISPVCSIATDGFQGFQHRLNFSQNQGVNRTIMKESWILIDSGSTFSSVGNHHMLSLCTPCDPMVSYTNGGELSYTAKGPVLLLPKIVAYFNGASIANIVSLFDVVQNYRVTMDSEIDNSIHVHMSDYKLIFKCCGEGLYFVDLMHIDEHKINMTVNEYSPVALNLLNIVSENKSFFSKKEIVAADEARTLQRRIGYPSNEDLKSYINTGQIINCAPTIDDVQRGVLIYGPLEAAIKGKMTKSKPQTVQQTPRVVIPSPVLQLHPTDEIAADFFLCIVAFIFS